MSHFYAFRVKLLALSRPTPFLNLSWMSLSLFSLLLAVHFYLIAVIIIIIIITTITYLLLILYDSYYFAWHGCCCHTCQLSLFWSDTHFFPLSHALTYLPSVLHFAGQSRRFRLGLSNVFWSRDFQFCCWKLQIQFFCLYKHIIMYFYLQNILAFWKGN